MWGSKVSRKGLPARAGWPGKKAEKCSGTMESNCSELRGEAWEKSRCGRMSPVHEHPGPHSESLILACDSTSSL